MSTETKTPAPAATGNGGKSKTTKRNGKYGTSTRVVHPPCRLDRLVRETCFALNAGEVAEFIELTAGAACHGGARPEDIRRRDELLRAAMARLPQPRSLAEACELVADLRAAARMDGLQGLAHDQIAARIELVEATIIRAWPAMSAAEALARLRWAQHVAGADPLPRFAEAARDVLRLAIHDLETFGGAA